MRNLLALLAALAVSHSAAAVTTLTLDTDRELYGVGELVELTLTLVTDGTEFNPGGLFVAVSWNGAIGDGADFSSQDNTLSVFGGASEWIRGSGQCMSDDKCVLLDQIGTQAPLIVDAEEVVATLQIEAIAIGGFDFVIVESSFNAFFRTAAGQFLTPGDVVFTDNARNARVVPEPATAALCMLGLAVLAAGRARSRIW